MKNINKSGIYKITNLITDKFYIGSAISFRKRWLKHKSDLNLNKHFNNHLQHSWNIYTENNFKFEILEIVNNLNELIIREQHYLDLYFQNINCYNLLPTAGSRLFYKTSSKTKEKLRVLHLGRKHSDETKKKISISTSGENNPNFNKIHSIETRAKMGISNIGKKHSIEHMYNRIIANTGRKNTEEMKKNISQKNSGRKLNDNNKTNMSLAKISKYMDVSNLNIIENKIIEIREKYRMGTYFYSDLSKEYGFSISTIGRIIKRKTWQHI